MEQSNAQESVRHLKELLPLNIYATLNKCMAKALITDIVYTPDKKNMIELHVSFQGTIHTNLFQAGAHMTMALRNHFNLPQKRSHTFDGWGRLKILIDDDSVFHVSDIITKDIRSGRSVFAGIPNETTASREQFFNLLESDILDGTPSTMETSISMKPLQEEIIISEQICDMYLPYLTILANHFCTNDPDILAEKLATLPHSKICEIVNY